MSDEETIKKCLDYAPNNVAGYEALSRLSEQNKKLREALTECRDVFVSDVGDYSFFAFNFPKAVAVLGSLPLAFDTAS